MIKGKIYGVSELEKVILKLQEHHHILWAIETTIKERRRQIYYAGSEKDFNNREGILESLRDKLHEVYKPDVEFVNRYSYQYINQMRQKFEYFKNRFKSKYDDKTY